MDTTSSQVVESLDHLLELGQAIESGRVEGQNGEQYWEDQFPNLPVT